ncbi:hypothetical protein LV716_00265 [Flagellimonas sp. HMM57]|uniref:hypothetical protein n=1 Tax=unclassified Flagellimonas TaxID=2644544 RepID=UPI0013D7D871|nr:MULTISPECIES: hypothetical protein [unclassified Flagellimonas]UII78016.1 hypothetical protein LV716_00265 [Flagellimonas sp. HMM57]
MGEGPGVGPDTIGAGAGVGTGASAGLDSEELLLSPVSEDSEKSLIDKSAQKRDHSILLPEPKAGISLPCSF